MIADVERCIFVTNNIYDRENIFQNDYKGYNFFLRKYKKLDQTFLLVILVRKL